MESDHEAAKAMYYFGKESAAPNCLGFVEDGCYFVPLFSDLIK